MSRLTTALTNLRQGLARFIVGKSAQSFWDSFTRGEALGQNNATLTRPYAQSVWVFRAIQHIAAPIAAREIEWEDANGQVFEDEELERFWAAPACNVEGRMSKQDFLEATLAWMNLEGQAFWILDDTWLNPRTKNKSPIFLARPDRMTIIRRWDTLLGWTFLDGAGMRHMLLPEQVRRPKFHNPYDELTGLAPLHAAIIAAASDFAAGVLSKNIMQNNGDRGAYVIAKTGVVSDEQRAQIEFALRQKRELSRRGEFKTAFLTGDISIEDPKVQSMDVQFVAQRLENRHEIYAAFGVPPSMADVTASYSVGSASDRYRLIEDTCQPLGSKVCEAIESVEMARTSRRLIARLNWDGHSVMQQVRQERAKVAGDLSKVGVPMSVLNQYLDLGMPEYDGWDVGYVPLNVQPVSKAKGVKLTPAQQEEQSEDDAAPLKALQEGFRGLADLFTKVPKLQVPSSEAPSSKAGNPERKKLWEGHMQLQSAGIKAISVQVEKCVAWARKETLQKLESAKAIAVARELGVLDIIFDLATMQGKMVAALDGPIRNILEESTQQMLGEVGHEDPWTMEDKKVIDYLDSRESKIKGASKEIWDQVKGQIQDSLQKGESNATMANKLKDEFNGISKDRAKVIAQTETGIAYNTARQATLEGTGIKYKEWLTAHDDKVRQTHSDVDGDVVPLDEAFDVGGEKLKHPGDPEGSAEEVINCRCVLLAARKPKA